MLMAQDTTGDNLPSTFSKPRTVQDASKLLNLENLDIDDISTVRPKPEN